MTDQADASRLFYTMYREANKLPVVLHTKLSGGLSVCSVKGHDFEISLDARNFCNAWEMKAECLRQFMELGLND